MTGVMKELLYGATIAGMYAAVFAAGEVVRRYTPAKPELPRKVVHLLSGFVALLLPCITDCHWTILLLAAGFALLMFLTRRKGLLQGVHGIERTSFGAMCFPLSIYLMFLLGHDQPVLYCASILVMTVSDSAAALVGKKYGIHRFGKEPGSKSLEGSMSFFASAFACIYACLFFMTQAGQFEPVFVVLVVALLATTIEASSPLGSDDLFVPLGTYYIFSKMLGHPLPAVIQAAEPLLWLVAAGLILQRLLAFSGIRLHAMTRRQSC